MIQRMHGTTVIALLHRGQAAIAGDGQVTHTDTIMKTKAVKIRSLANGKILAGYAGTAGDALALFDIFDKKLEETNGHLSRAAIEMVKEWRTEKSLQQLDAMIAVCDKKTALMVSGSGDIVEPDDGIVTIGSGGPFALAAARAFLRANPKLAAEKVARMSLEVAADICIYTNREITVKGLK